MLRFRTRQLRADSDVSRSQEIEFAAWSVTQRMDDHTIVLFPRDNEVIHVVVFQPRGGTQTLVVRVPPLVDIHKMGAPHRQ